MQELEKILEEIDHYVKVYKTPPFGREVEGTVELLERCRDIIRKHMNDGWIPVEKPPKKTGYYLVQLSKRLPNEDFSDRVVVLYNGEEKEFMAYSSLIIAWCPLPAPYRPERPEPYHLTESESDKNDNSL